MTFGFLDRGRQKKAAGEGGKKIRTHCIVTPWTSPSSYPCTQIQSLWPQSLARLFSIPNLFFFPSFYQPVTHCAGKSDFLFSRGSKLKAQP